MYAEMAKKRDFAPVLWSAFAIMFSIYAFVGAAGYALYGSTASVLITQDMSDAASDLGTRVLVSVVLAAMTFKLFCGVPMCIIVLVDIVCRARARATD